ncbi:MAG: hypothetical protein GWO85_01440 [Simkaniaceae bacterium]|nr:hypothetical protein [Simkaniaceae bacterium]
MKTHYNPKLKQLAKNLKDNCMFSEVWLPKMEYVDKHQYTPRPDSIGTPLFLEGTDYITASLHFTGHPKTHDTLGLAGGGLHCAPDYISFRQVNFVANNPS